jgi:hypothetical protein
MLRVKDYFKKMWYPFGFLSIIFLQKKIYNILLFYRYDILVTFFLLYSKNEKRLNE